MQQWFVLENDNADFNVFSYLCKQLKGTIVGEYLKIVIFTCGYNCYFSWLYLHTVSWGVLVLFYSSPGFDTWFSRTAMEPVHAVSSTWVVGHEGDDIWSRETLFQEESSNSSAMEQKKIMKLSRDISSSLSWVLFSIIYLWSIYIGGDLILKMFQQIREFTLIRLCLHKSQIPFLP